MNFKRGKKPARYTLHSMRSALAFAAAVDPLGPPPVACNDYLAAVRSRPCPMMLNDTLGDCVCADTGHQVMIKSANTGLIVSPQDSDVEALYRVVGGYTGDPSTDNGCVETDMCSYLKTTGWIGYKLDAFSTIDPHNLDHMRWSIYLFGALRIGLSLPGYAENQFDAGKPWDVSSTGDQSQGGHDVCLTDYHGDMFYCSTWGRWDQPVTPAFLQAFCDEAHPEISFDWINAQGVSPSNFDLATLEELLKEAAA